MSSLIPSIKRLHGNDIVSEGHWAERPPAKNFSSSLLTSSSSRTLSHKIPLSFLWLLLCGALAGCGGGQDYGSFQRGLGGDIGNSYDTSLSSRYGDNTRRAANGVQGTYPKIETSFEIEKLEGDPFDYEKVNVQVTLRKPDGSTVDVPAFFDGGTTWRMRYTPSAAGQYSVVEVKLNREKGRDSKLETKEWTVGGEPQPGFARIDRGDKTRFVFDSGARYFPIGHNVGWQGDSGPIPGLFEKMKAAGENWSRVWMCHWDGKNLDWSNDGKQGKPGEINLEVAKKWDEIVEAAEKNGIYFQMVLQHHGQVSTAVNPNWNENPYNAEKGGFLKNPTAFFTDPQARALTKRKLYYILARWGYSPNILAFELFNEVEHTDSGRAKLWDDIAMWHREMALFLRQYDGYQHLLTTSALPAVAKESPIWDTVDFYQTHTYAPDTIVATGSPFSIEGKKLEKPHFIGEFGPPELKDTEGIALHNGLWASLTASPSGAAQYWDWESVDKNNHYDHFRAVASFVTASGLAGQGGLTHANLKVESSQNAALRFAPGGGWKKAEAHEFVVGKDGPPAGIAQFPSFLYGVSKRDMMPKPLTLQVNYAQPGAIMVTVGQVAKAGAKLAVGVDGKTTERAYPAADSDYRPKAEEATVRVEVPAGAHTITLESVGEDWLTVREIALADYVPALAASARIGAEFAVAWVYHRDNVDAPKEKALQTATGRVLLPGLKPGRYQATWWDTRTGASLDAVTLEVAKDKEAGVNTPPVSRDVALYVVKATKEPQKSGRDAAKATGTAQKTNATRPAANRETSSGPRRPGDG